MSLSLWEPAKIPWSPGHFWAKKMNFFKLLKLTRNHIILCLRTLFHTLQPIIVVYKTEFSQNRRKWKWRFQWIFGYFVPYIHTLSLFYCVLQEDTGVKFKRLQRPSRNFGELVPIWQLYIYKYSRHNIMKEILSGKIVIFMVVATYLHLRSLWANTILHITLHCSNFCILKPT